MLSPQRPYHLAGLYWGCELRFCLLALLFTSINHIDVFRLLHTFVLRDITLARPTCTMKRRTKNEPRLAVPSVVRLQAAYPG